MAILLVLTVTNYCFNKQAYLFSHQKRHMKNARSDGNLIRCSVSFRVRKWLNFRTVNVRSMLALFGSEFPLLTTKTNWTKYGWNYRGLEDTHASIPNWAPPFHTTTLPHCNGGTWCERYFTERERHVVCFLYYDDQHTKAIDTLLLNFLDSYTCCVSAEEMTKARKNEWSQATVHA